MKKHIALLLIVTLLLTGCAVNADSQPQTTTPVLTEETIASATEETIVVIEETVPETTVPETVPEETIPQETQPEQTQPATPQTTTQQTTTQSSSQSKPTESAKPATSSRPTSSATSKDTGSSEIWIDPAVYNWEENDPQRTSYVQSNTNFTTIYADFGSHSILGFSGGMDMYIGHTYGMPFLHEGDISELTWVSSDPSVATVNNVGFVTPLKEGETEIGFYNARGEYFRRTVRVHVEVKHTEAELEQMAKEEAKAIANYIMNELSLSTDLERISVAARIVYEYMDAGNTIPSYTINPDGSTSCNVVGYNRPFGTLITGYSTCAGDVRALGLVLEYMGFEWYHVNANKWDHQWCVVYDVDGQTAFADAAWYGVVGYGERQEDGSNFLRYEEDVPVPIR